MTGVSETCLNASVSQSPLLCHGGAAFIYSCFVILGVYVPTSLYHMVYKRQLSELENICAALLELVLLQQKGKILKKFCKATRLNAGFEFLLYKRFRWSDPDETTGELDEELRWRRLIYMHENDILPFVSRAPFNDHAAQDGLFAAATPADENAQSISAEEAASARGAAGETNAVGLASSMSPLPSSRPPTSVKWRRGVGCSSVSNTGTQATAPTASTADDDDDDEHYSLSVEEAPSSWGMVSATDVEQRAEAVECLWQSVSNTGSSASFMSSTAKQERLP